jgi:hypothetical protein
LLLQSFPVIGQQYHMKLITSIPVVVNEPIWMLYEVATAYYNGYLTVEEFEDLCYCLCTPLQMVWQTRKEVIFIFQVEQILTLEDCADLPVSSLFRPSGKILLSVV